MIEAYERRPFDASRVRPRRAAFVFPPDVPRYWVGGRVGRTHLMNALHLFLPPFERMIVQLVRHHVLPQLRDPELAEQARGFMAQEAIHGRAHEAFHENLRAQGYAIDRYVARLDRIFQGVFVRRLGPTYSLAMVAAFEHYTDLLVPLVLDGDFLEGCDPRVRELLAWHAAEEIEHNAVAFEMLGAVDRRATVRFAGNVLGLGVIFGALFAGTVLLLWQDGKLLDRKALGELGQTLFGKYRIVPEAARLFVAYSRSTYSPDPPDHALLAQAVLGTAEPVR